MEIILHEFNCWISGDQNCTVDRKSAVGFSWATSLGGLILLTIIAM